MKKAKQITWLVVTVKEPFPVFPQFPEGPRYAAGSKWYSFANQKNRAHAEWQAAHLRTQGYTVTVTEEVRS